MIKSLRVLELSGKLKVSPEDIIAICAILKIPANSRISCLSDKHAQIIINYYQNTRSENGIVPFSDLA